MALEVFWMIHAEHGVLDILERTEGRFFPDVAVLSRYGVLCMLLVRLAYIRDPMCMGPYGGR